MKQIAKALAATGLVLGAGTVGAEISGNVALSSDYMFRGISQTDNTPAISGGFDYEHDSGFYAGVWASNVDSAFFSGANVEIDTYLGFAGGMDNWSYDIGFLRYNYPGTNFSDNNTNEFYGSVGYDFGVFSVAGGLAYSPDFFGLDDSEYYSLGVDIPVGDYSIALAYGAQDMDDAKNYEHYSVGVSGEAMGLGLDLTWHGSDDDAETFAGNNLTESRVVFTVSKSL